MTEKGWKESTDIEQMIECLVERRFPEAEPCDWKRGERKKRLFVRACLNRIWPLLPVELRAVCEMLDAEADGQISKEKREAVWSAAEGLSGEHDNLLFALGYDDIGLLCYIAARMATEDCESREQASLLRDIFGNPFSRISVNPAWLTPTVTTLAAATYEERALPSGELNPIRLGVLADALDDAGCQDAVILEHLRGPGPHVRGCWVVDLLTGRD
jgi:hypothetical protein